MTVHIARNRASVALLSLTLVGLLLALVVSSEWASKVSASSDRDALVALYNATDGANWTNSAPASPSVSGTASPPTTPAAS